jgi:hypothetical protein
MKIFLLILLIILISILLYETFGYLKEKLTSGLLKSLEQNINKILGTYFLTVIVVWVLSRLFSNNPFMDFFSSFGLHFPIIESDYGVEYTPDHKLISKLMPVFFVFGPIFIYLQLSRILNYFKKKLPSMEQITPISIISTGDILFISSIIFLILLVKEVNTPFYFTQDDTHSQFLPKIIISIQLLLKGEFPFIDNFHHFGAPIFEIGTYAVLDPLMISSYIIAKEFFNNVFLTVEIYAIICMFFGAVIFGICLRNLKIDSLVGIAAIFCYILCGYFLMIGRSWYYVFGIVLYLPILLYFFLKILQGKYGFLWLLGSGLARALFFYAGNSQFFIYGASVELVSYVYLILKGKNRKEVFIGYICSLLFTFGLIAPLFISQIQTLKSVERLTEPLISIGSMPIDALISSFIPSPLFQSTPTWGNKNWWLLPNMWHVGILWMACFYAGSLLYIKTGKCKYHQILLLAMFLFIICSGPVSLIYPLKHFIPVLNKMHKAFKIYPFALFLIIIFSAFVLTELKRIVCLRNILNIILILNIIVTGIVAVYFTDTAFYMFAEKPYPELKPEIRKLVSKDDIICSFTNIRYDKPSYVTLLPHNYSALYDLMVVNIYDPLLPTKIKQPPPKADLRDYFGLLGVTKVIIQNASIPTNWRYFAGQFEKFKMIYKNDLFTLYDFNNPKWLLWPYSFSVPIGSNYLPEVVPEIIQYTRTKIKAKIDSPVESGWLYHNEYRDGYYIFIDGVKHKLNQSRHGWCYFKLPAGEHIIEIGYMPPMFFISVVIGFILLIVSVFIYFIYMRNLMHVK